MKKTALSCFLVLTLLVGIIPVSASAAFGDIFDPGTALAVAVLKSMGVVSGTSANTYSPDSQLTRAQFCAFAVRTMGLEDQAAINAYKTLFSDAKPGSWYTGYVNLSYSQGIINGYGNGKFGPDDSVTYGQVVTILLRLLGYTSDDVGKVWPTDYVNYAKKLELSEGLSLQANSVVTRGQAAVLLYNMLGTETNGKTQKYFETINGVASTQTVIILDSDATTGGSYGMLMTCDIGTVDTSIEYYSQKLLVPDDLVGHLGTLLLNSAGKTIGFMPSSNKFVDVTVSSAKSSGITSASGSTYRVSGSAQVIYNSSLYTYSAGGYIQVDNQKSKNARLYYNDGGAVDYVYISSGSSSNSTEAIVAETKTAASELGRRLGIPSSSYSISKNGYAADSNDIAQYDVAYYDAVTKTMRVSDYKITGYIEAASPSVAAANSITIAGCSLEVLESAWDTLDNFSLGSRVTLLLTDDCKVAAAYSTQKIFAEMIGILSPDGNSVALPGCGLVLTSDTITASASLRGTLVNVTQSANTSLVCSVFSAPGSIGNIDILAKTIGSYNIAPGCAIYEWAGSGYVSSLSGKQGESSSDFNDITWTESLSSFYVSYYHLNSAGQVDVLLLKDVTGNCYEYGRIRVYYEEEGINLGSATMPSYNNAATITNSKNLAESSKYLYTQYNYYGDYEGIVMSSSNSDAYLRVAAVSTLTSVSQVSPKTFFQREGKWFATIGEYEVPVSDNVQVHVRIIEKWYSGQEGLLTALSSDLPMTVYYDRSLAAGAQIRIITIEPK